MQTQQKRKPTGRHPGLRSFDTRLFYCPVSVRFYNMTHRLVDVLWVDNQQNYILYKTLKPREFYDVLTYVGHPWVFEDSITRDSMVSTFLHYPFNECQYWQLFMFYILGCQWRRNLVATTNTKIDSADLLPKTLSSMLGKQSCT